MGRDAGNTFCQKGVTRRKNQFVPLPSYVNTAGARSGENKALGRVFRVKERRGDDVVGSRLGVGDRDVVNLSNADERLDIGVVRLSRQRIGEEYHNVKLAVGNKRADLAETMLGYQTKKFIGAYTAAMNGLDAIVFTAGIGENTARVRELALEGMEYFGIEIDKDINNATKVRNGVTKLSTESSKVLVYMIPTNEELVIAKDTERLAGGLKK